MIYDTGQISPVLLSLPESARPTGDCASCEAALWSTTATELQAHCMAMGSVVYSSGEHGSTAVLKCSALKLLGDS